MDNYSDLAISLRAVADGRYTVDLSFRPEASPVAVELDCDVPVALDLAALRAQELDPRAYGRVLSDMFFADPRMREAWVAATSNAAGRGAGLRLRLRISHDAADLHTLRWETLCDPRTHTLLATSETLLLSRYLDSAELSALARPRRSTPRALIAVANPGGLQLYQLAAVDVAGELARAQAALGDIAADLLGAEKRASLGAIVEALRARDDYDILYLVCHGTITDGESYLWLENERGSIQKISGSEFAESLGRLPPANRPGLVVLAACAGAGAGYAALAAAGPRLARTGALAVLAMQGSVPMTTVERLMPAFFRELRRDGRADRALAVARGSLGDDAGWWMPVLFMRVDDGRIWEAPSPRPTPSLRPAQHPARIFISYKRSAEPDEGLALDLHRMLGTAGHQVFIDQAMTIGTNWRREIEQQIEAADFLIVLLSEASVHSEMVTAEIEHALRHNRATGKARLLPLRVAFDGKLPYRLAQYLDDLHYAEWRRRSDTDGLVASLLTAIEARTSLPVPIPQAGELPAADPRLPLAEADPRFLDSLDEPGGAERLGSEFYIERDEDAVLQRELGKRQGKTITIRAARQTGKTSLLIRGVHQLKGTGAKVAHIDLQSAEESRLASLDSFLEWFARLTVRKLRLDQSEVDAAWRSGIGALDKLSYLLEDYVIPAAGRVVLAIDEADRVLATSYHSDFFGMIRSWHNNRAISDVWDELDILMVISTEPHLLIKDVSQSPFNVGTRLRLRDFTLDQVAELNRRYRSPLADSQLPELFDYLGGHPYLTRKALYTLVCEQIRWETLLAVATSVNSPFGDHLRRYYWLISGQSDLEAEVRHLLTRGACTSEQQYYRLFQAGLVTGVDARSCRFRCRLYEEFLREKLG